MVGLKMFLLIMIVMIVFYTIEIIDILRSHNKSQTQLNKVYETEYDFYHISENSGGKKTRPKKQIPQVKAKAK